MADDTKTSKNDKTDNTLPGYPSIPGSYTLTKDKSSWTPNDARTKKAAKAFIKEAGDKAAINISVK